MNGDSQVDTGRAASCIWAPLFEKDEQTSEVFTGPRKPRVAL